jgi:hypothetical protein
MRIYRSAVSAIIAVALVTLPLAAARHVHRAGIEGRTVPLVHAHRTDASNTESHAGGMALHAQHGDHSRALFLNGDFTASSGSTASAVSPGSIISTAPPIIDGGDVVPAVDSSTIHGPPRLPSITRGPPSLS